MGENEGVNPEVCLMRHQVIDKRCGDLEDEMQGMRGDIKEVRDLQKQILYAIIGIFGTLVVTLIGVIMGRAVDFGVLFLR
jgi:hypothetical protein